MGSMTAFLQGDINSGLSYVATTFGNDPITNPGNLTWSRASAQIDPTASVVTDLIMAGKERVEGNILYVYAIGHTGRLYKIQVNNPATFDPEYDNPVLVTTLTAQTPTFTRGGFMDFYGTTEQIYIGHDKGVTRINFDGTGETFVGVIGSWTQNVPRPLQQFIGSLFVGNGENLAEIDETTTVTTYTKLSPGFPRGTQVRDIDVNTEGTYLQAVVTRLPLGDITSSTQNVTQTANAESFIFAWNGTDVGYTSYNSFPTYSLTANTMFGAYQYTFGYDQFGAAVYNPVNKLFALQEVVSPLPNAVSSSGNFVNFITPLSFDGRMEADFITYGSLDFEVGPGYWDWFGQFASGSETDIIQVPFQMPVSNFGIGADTNGYPAGVYGVSKIYFSTLETSNAPTTAYRLYKWIPPTSPSLTTGDALEGAVYQTQSQIFSKKVQIHSVRVYTEPLQDGASFQVELIGSSGEAMDNGTKIFTVQNTDPSEPAFVGSDYLLWSPTPGVPTTYVVGVRITNLSATNSTVIKIEIDYNEGGQ